MATIVVKEPVEDLNKFSFTGVITGKRENSAVQTVYFRAMTQNGARRYNNTPALHVFDDSIKEKVNQIPLRTKVHVEGYITSSKNGPEKSAEAAAEGRRRPLQSFVLTSIEPAEKDAPDENVIEIVGAVERAYVSRGGNVNFIIVSFREGGRYMKRIKVEGFPRAGVNYLEFMAAGTRVHIVGHCSTRSEETDTGTAYYEYIVLDNIEKA